jgi:hypothetical protein
MPFAKGAKATPASLCALAAALGLPSATMTRPAIPDVITVVASAYFQPIADLVDKLLSKPTSKEGPGGVSMHENGYSAALVVLLVAVLESYTSRLRFVRRSERIEGNLSTPDLLEKYFPALPTKDELVEIFLIRNVLAHNHIWHLDVSDFAGVGAPTISNPIELGFKTNKHYEQVVDISTRRTRALQLNISPTSVGRTDVWKAFDIIWRTLKYMNAQDFSHTPLGGSTISFRGERREFADLLQVLKDGCSASPP